MRLGVFSLGVVLLLALTTGARADVDWSEYIDDNPAPSRAAEPGTQTAEPAPAPVKVKKAKRVAKAKRGKAMRTKAKARKTKKRR